MNRGVALVVLVLAAPATAMAAIGCTLSNPAEDLKYLFPAMTSYKEDLKEFPRLPDGAALFEAFRERVGSALDPIYETYETPYTVYSVFRGDSRIGIVHGVNVPGRGGVIQVFVSTDPATGEVRQLFFQRLESPAAAQLRSKEFRNQLTGLTAADFYKHDYYGKADPGAAADRVGQLQQPALAASGVPDYEAALRGVRKNLVLLDFFVYGRRFEPFFERARKASTARRAAKEGK